MSKPGKVQCVFLVLLLLGLLAWVILPGGEWFSSAKEGSQRDGTSQEGGAGSSKAGERSNLNLPDRSRDRMVSLEKYGNLLFRDTLTTDQLEDYVESKGRSRDALLAAGFFGTGGENYLREAIKKFPGDLAVQFIAVSGSLISEEERAEWLARLQSSQPDNSLVSLLSAEFYLGQEDRAKVIEQLARAVEQDGFNDFSDVLTDLGAQMFRDTGSSEMDARLRSNFGVSLQYLSRVQNIAGGLKEMIARETDAGISNELALLGVGLGSQVREADGSPLLSQEFVGISVQESFLDQLGPNFQIPDRAINSTQMRDELENSRIDRVGATQDFPGTSFTREDVLEYTNRVRQEGEYLAIRWLQQINASRSASEPEIE